MLQVLVLLALDGGQTFGDKINLSNTTDADSWRVEIYIRITKRCTSLRS